MQVRRVSEIKEGLPSAHDFSLVRRYIRTRFVKEPAVLAALLCGSGRKGKHSGQTVTSDLDYVAVYAGEAFGDIQRLGARMGTYAAQHHVPLNIAWIPFQGFLLAPHEDLNIGFYRHLETAVKAGGNIKGDALAILLPILDSPIATPFLDAAGYLRRCAKKIAQWQMCAGECPPREVYLTKVLGYAVHIMRRMLDVIGLAGSQGSARSVAILYHKECDEELRYLAAALMQWRQQYVALLEKADFDEGECEAFLKALENEFVSLLSTFIFRNQCWLERIKERGG